MSEDVAGGRKLRIKKASQLIADDLKAQIIRGELHVGDSLPSETVLTERYGVSRPTFREAIRILEAEDLVRTTRGGRGGAKVRHPSAERAASYAGMVLQLKGATIRDVLGVRAALLPKAAKLAAQHSAQSDFTQLDSWLERIEGNVSDTRMMFLHSQAIELEIASLSRSETMKLLTSMLAILTERHLYEVPASLRDLPDFVVRAIPAARARTRALVSAIKGGRAEDAFRIAEERMAAEEENWDKRVEYSERLKLIV